MTTIDGTTYLTVPECLERLPFVMSERTFRRVIRKAGIGIVHRWQLVLTEADLAKALETLRLDRGRRPKIAPAPKVAPCPSSSSAAAKSTISRVPSADSVMSRARELAQSHTRKRSA